MNNIFPYGPWSWFTDLQRPWIDGWGQKSYTIRLNELIQQQFPELDTLDKEQMLNALKSVVFDKMDISGIRPEYQDAFILGFGLEFWLNELGQETVDSWKLAVWNTIIKSAGKINFIYEMSEKQLFRNYSHRVNHANQDVVGNRQSKRNFAENTANNSQMTNNGTTSGTNSQTVTGENGQIVDTTQNIKGTSSQISDGTTSGTNKQTNNTTTGGTTDSTQTNTGSTSSSTDGTESGTSNGLQAFQDTPQNGLSDVENLTYLTNATVNRGSSSGTDHSTTEGTSSDSMTGKVTNSGTSDSTIDGTTSGTSKTTVTGNNGQDSTGKQTQKGTNTQTTEGTTSATNKQTMKQDGTGSVAHDETANEDTTGTTNTYGTEDYFEVDYDTIMMAGTTLDAVWALFDECFMEVF